MCKTSIHSLGTSGQDVYALKWGLESWDSIEVFINKLMVDASLQFKDAFNYAWEP